MFALMFLMLFGIEENILLTCLMLKILMKKNIPTKARPIKKNAETVEFCKKEINDLLQKKLIRNSKSPWCCATFSI